jgi:hypothetical protein
MSTDTKSQASSKFNLTTLSTLIAIMTGGLGIFFLLNPDDKPVVPDEMGATISNVKIEPNISLNDYLLSSGVKWGISANRYTSEQLQEIGHVVSYTAEIKGFNGRKCVLQWSLFSADTQSRVAGMADRYWGDLTPEAASDKASEPIWIPLPSIDGNYFVRLAILDDKGVTLATEDSNVFQVTTTRLKFLPIGITLTSPVDPRCLAWKTFRNDLAGSRDEIWSQFVSTQSNAMGWLEFKDQSLVCNPVLIEDDFTFIYGKQYLLP